MQQTVVPRRGENATPLDRHQKLETDRHYTRVWQKLLYLVFRSIGLDCNNRQQVLGLRFSPSMDKQARMIWAQLAAWQRGELSPSSLVLPAATGRPS